MARVLILGASGGIGLETVKAALAEGHEVKAFARNAAGINIDHPMLEKIPGNALSRSDLNIGLDNVNVVVYALGLGMTELFKPVHLFSDTTKLLISEMNNCSVNRLIAVTGFGAGDSKNAIGCLQKAPFRLFLGRAYDDKTLQEQMIKNSSLDWTIVRPGVLSNNRGRKTYNVIADLTKMRNGIISRADVADFIVRQIESDEYVRKSPVIVD